MLALVGIFIVFGSIIGGYLLEAGNIHVLFQPAEFLIIGGAAIGSLIISCPPSLVSNIIKSLPAIITDKKLEKRDYLELLNLLYTIFTIIKKDGLLSIEKAIEKPEESPIFQKYPNILKRHHAVQFICDNLKVFGVGIKPTDFEEIMDIELETQHNESSLPASAITKVADSLPGFGIVAAVLGVVITMGKMSESPEVIGHSIAAALVGTFLGILLCYGLFGPIGTHLEHKAMEEAKYFEAIKLSMLAFFAKDFQAQVAVEAGRRVLFSDVKPSFVELEETVRKK